MSPWSHGASVNGKQSGASFPRDCPAGKDWGRTGEPNGKPIPGRKWGPVPGQPNCRMFHKYTGLDLRLLTVTDALRFHHSKMEAKEVTPIHKEHASIPAAPPVDPALDASVRKKLDWRILPILTLTYLMAFIDR